MRDVVDGKSGQALSLQGLTKYYGSLAAVKDVDLDIAEGRFLTILGPSGGGKTTVLMAIAGFVEPSAGTILLGGRDITGLPPDKRNFGMVFQGYALFPHMTVAENLWFPLRVRGVSRADSASKVAAALDLVQMSHLGERYPAQLSGGQQQRVALARAMVFEPALLLLDEPLSALDKKLRSELQWELKSLHERLGTTFIYVTHDQEEALSMSDEVVIMREGRIEQRGEPAELYERPATRFVADFLGKSNFITGTVEGADGGEFRYAADGATFVQQATAAVEPGRDVVISLRPEKLAITPRAAPPETANRLEGRVAAVNYLGSSIHFRVETEALGDFLVASPAWTCAVDQAAGTPVWLGWRADASVPVEP
ncbi:ABC transporter ATP-binding protein [Acuticoccus sp.]|uniref:ABC transporter ATP-binding protein n=1 Tax=Acuticoccus sp. TaxID=1904378 RepID=UPI003B525632